MHRQLPAQILCPVLYQSLADLGGLPLLLPLDLMELSLVLGNLLILILTGLLMYYYSATFRYYTKVTVLDGYLIAISIVSLPFFVAHGRTVENMRIIRTVMCPIRYLLGIKVKVQGKENLDIEGPYVIVANHQSNVDFIVMFEALPERCVTVAKKEILYMGTFGLCCWLSKFIFIDRRKTDRAISVMSKVAQTMHQEDLRVWVFPEGTRSYGTTMLPFKHGAFHLAVQAQVPVVPVVLSSYSTFFNRENKRFTTGECTIQILPHVQTQELGPDDVPRLTECVRQTMLTTFQKTTGGGAGLHQPIPDRHRD
uniref:1-acyl-sn-glycerol-3-phosphate acyltransferase n=1 Tax=Crocodylus porosus TaxID=8502 RepID=A0A7M4ELT1_CROPO